MSRQKWNHLFLELPDGITGPDVTATWEWQSALIESGVAPRIDTILEIETSESHPGLVPIVRPGSDQSFSNRVIQPVTEAFCGRADLLLQPPFRDALENLFARLMSELKHWDVFVFTLNDQSPISSALDELIAAHRVRPVLLEQLTSPYIVFPLTWEEYFASLPKKLRWTIRKSEKDLRSLGDLRYQHFESAEDIDAFAAAIMAIEESSWKEESETSITKQTQQRKFYEALLPLAAKSGLLSGHLLSLDTRPIAYILGLRFRGVFNDLKESFDNRLRQHSPGHVLKRFAFPTIMADELSVYDFMGECERYKMKWTDRTYTRRRFAVFNASIGGRVGRARAQLASIRRCYKARS